MVKLCECGCGLPAPIAKKTDKSSGRIKGQPQRFVWGHNIKKNKNNITITGRQMAYCYKHPKANKRGYIPNYILVAEKAFGKYLPNGAVVHHIDGNPINDNNDNLVICQDTAYHTFLHHRIRAYQECGDASRRRCSICRQYDDPENLYIKGHNHCYHRKCQTEYHKKWRKSKSC